MKKVFITLISVVLIIPAGELSAGGRSKRQEPLTTRVYLMPGKHPKAAERKRSDTDSATDSATISAMTDNERLNELIRELYIEKGVAPPNQRDSRNNNNNNNENEYKYEFVHFGKKILRFISGLLNK